MIEWVSSTCSQGVALCSGLRTLMNDGGDVKDGLAHGKLLCNPHLSGCGKAMTSFSYLFALKGFQRRCWVLGRITAFV